MNKRKIVFRADGGPFIGMGHFVRTLALAEMLKNHFQCIYATRQPTEYQISEIKKTCHGRIDLPEDDSHFEEFLLHLKGDEIVVLDNYYFTTEYQRAIKGKGCKLVCIDDMHNKHFVSDLVINHSIGIDSSFYSLEQHTKLLLGFKYALLRKEFFNEFNQKIDKSYAYLIIMGGGDPFGVTNHLLEILANSNTKKPIAVVSTKKTLHKNTVWFNNLSANRISTLMEDSEIGIFPASSVAIEACAKRLPFICGYFIDNQIELYFGIKREKVAICIGDLNKLSQDILYQAISKLEIAKKKSTILENQTKIIDNKVFTRILNEFQLI